MSTNYWVQWDPTNKKWIYSTNQGGSWNDLVENPTLEKTIFNGISAPSGIASKGILYYDSTSNRLKLSENNGAFSNLCREDGYPATNLDINGLSAETTIDDDVDYIPYYKGGVSPANKKMLVRDARRFAGAKVSRNSVLSIPNTTLTVVTWTTNDYDVGGFWNAGSPNRLTVPSGLAGYYLCQGNFAWPANGATARRIAQLERNSNGTPTNANCFCREDKAPASASAFPTGCVAGVIYLAVGDEIEAIVYQDSGNAMNLDRISGYQTSIAPWMALTWLGR